MGLIGLPGGRRRAACVSPSCPGPTETSSLPVTPTLRPASLAVTACGQERAGGAQNGGDLRRPRGRKWESWNLKPDLGTVSGCGLCAARGGGRPPLHALLLLAPRPAASLGVRGGRVVLDHQGVGPRGNVTYFNALFHSLKGSRASFISRGIYWTDSA